jgi:two-component system, chemotaxis family, sensor kinase Cph1
MSGLSSNYRLTAICIWLLAVTTSFAWNIADDIREQNDIAKVTARAFFDQIIASRQWNLMHGGVYVYTTENSPPNPYLPEDRRSIRDENGRALTLINPSYMTRQIATISREKGQVRFHITSLTPLRPENKPYPWEIAWLESFALGSTEKSGFFATDNEEKSFHYMAPLPYSQSCYPCHASAAQPEGNVRGGISVSLPIPFHKSPWPLIISHLLVAVTGIIGILFFGGRLAHSKRNILATNRQLELEIEERKQTEKELITIKENLEHIVDNRTAELRKTNEILDSKIQEQLKIEASLVSINDEFIQIFNSAPDGMHVIDRNFNVIRVNRAYCKLTRIGIKEIQGHKCYDVFSGKPCHTEECPLTQIINGAERVELEVRKTRKDGKTIPCIVTATPFRDPEGKLTGIIEVTRDVSNWKEIERSLSATAQHLRARNMELEDFAHVISHDLQEPLMLIQAFSDRIRTKCATDLPEKGITYLERIESSTKRMQNLIDGLLLYSRVSSKAIPFEQVELQDVINSVLDDLALRIEKNHASISVDAGLPTIEADPLQMRQLFQNIIGNSLKYIHPERRPEIAIKRIVFPDQYDNQTHIRFSIEDNGVGFKEEHQKRIFDIFQRLHTRQQFQGTGIGLSICKKIIERHRGTITAEGMPGIGAKFIITLPLVQKNLCNEKERDDNFIDIAMNRR